MEGILTRKKHELRVVISIEIIMRSVTVEVSEFEIEPVALPNGQLMGHMKSFVHSIRERDDHGGSVAGLLLVSIAVRAVERAARTRWIPPCEREKSDGSTLPATAIIGILKSRPS